MKLLVNNSDLEDFNIFLGRKIKAKRVFENHTSQEVADKIKIARQYYMKRENGVTPFRSDELKAIFEYLNFNESEISEIFLH